MATITFLRSRVYTRVTRARAHFFFVAYFSEHPFGRRVLKCAINARDNADFAIKPGR